MDFTPPHGDEVDDDPEAVSQVGFSSTALLRASNPPKLAPPPALNKGPEKPLKRPPPPPLIAGLRVLSKKIRSNGLLENGFFCYFHLNLEISPVAAAGAAGLGVFSLSEPALGVLQSGQAVTSGSTMRAHFSHFHEPCFPRSVSGVVAGIGEVDGDAMTRDSVLFTTTREEEVEEVPRLMASSSKASSSASSAGVIFSRSVRGLLPPPFPGLFNSKA